MAGIGDGLLVWVVVLGLGLWYEMRERESRARIEGISVRAMDGDEDHHHFGIYMTRGAGFLFASFVGDANEEGRSRGKHVEVTRKSRVDRFEEQRVVPCQNHEKRI